MRFPIHSGLGLLSGLALLSTPLFAQTPGCNALELTRSLSYARVAHNAALVPSSISVEAWVLLANNFPGRGTIIRKNTTGGREAWLLRIEGRRLNFSVRGTSGFRVTFSTATIPSGVATHVAATWDGTTTRLYIDGKLVTTKTAAAGTLLSGAGEMRIGQGNLTAIEQFRGRLDEVRIWNTARSTNEIANNRRRILNRATGEVASYSFDRNFRDSTGNFDGTFVGSGQNFTTSVAAFGRLTNHPKGARDGSEFANRVKRLGDVNDDGYEDYSVAQSNGLSGQSNRGALRIYSGFDHRVLIALQGDSDGNLYGSDSDGADLNGDGIPEILVGEPGHNNNRGRIWVIDGRTRARRVLAQGRGSGEFGALVLAVPYLDADGRCDIITTEDNELVALRAAGSEIWRITPSAGKRVRALDLVGDVNRDGFDDVICGTPEHGTTRTNEGRYSLVAGKTGRVIQSVIGGATGMRFGDAVAGVRGDVDGDKVPDFVVAGSQDRNKRGRLSVRSGLTGAKVYNSILGTTDGQILGRELSAAMGDVNGDGFWDMRVSERNGTRGQVQVFDVRKGTFVGVLRGATNSPEYGASIAGLETNGSPRPDIIVAETGVRVTIFDNCPVDRAPSHKTYGAICAGTGGRSPRLAVVDKSGVRVNGSYTMRVASARPNSAVVLQLAVGRANIALDAIGMIGCRYLVGSSILGLTSAVDARGFADVALRVPADPALAGARVNFQALCLDQGGNAFNLTTTNGAEVVHGTSL